MLNQKKIEIFLTKIRKSLAKQFLEITIGCGKVCNAKQCRGIGGRHCLKATSKNSTFRINKRLFFETFAFFDFVDVAIARKS